MIISDITMLEPNRMWRPYPGGKQHLYSRENPYNRPTTQTPFICQFCENGLLVSAVLSVLYKKVKNLATDSMNVSSCGSLATVCASSFQHAFIGNLAVLQWSDVSLTSTPVFTYTSQVLIACTIDPIGSCTGVYSWAT